MFLLTDLVPIVGVLCFYLGFGVVGAWIYDRFVRPRLYGDTVQ